MALPDHSLARTFNSTGSPHRPLNGHPESQHPTSLFGPRQMLPPSPHFPPRFSHNPPPPTVSPSPTSADTRNTHPFQKRPGSSMSISSMLGSDAERPTYPQLNYRPTPTPNTSTAASSMSLGAVMSPPQMSQKPAIGEYSYKPRSQTPDRISYPAHNGARQFRSSSGSFMQRPGPFDDRNHHVSGSISVNGRPAKFHIHPAETKVDPEDRMRRTSLSGILQRPSSQPQSADLEARLTAETGPVNRPGWSEPNGLSPIKTVNGRTGSEYTANNSSRQTATNAYYDIRPPDPGDMPRPFIFGPQPRPATSVHHLEKGPSQPPSPEASRHVPLVPHARNSIPNSIPENAASQMMSRQDSSQSQSDRFLPGERSRMRYFSPFASSVTSQHQSATSVPPEELGRKGSDELSQHRAILGLAAESKRGRYSPLPQAVQGAQAQTPTPDGGIKSEHGRVFSGIGSGIASSTPGQTPAPPGLSASPFKRDEGVARLSEDNLMKISRSTPGALKRPRKLKDDGDRGESEGDRRMTGAGRGVKKSRQNMYDLDGESGSQRRSTPTSAFQPYRRTATPSGSNILFGANHARHQPNAIARPHVYKPKTKIQIASVLKVVSHTQRRHLGSLLYSPEIAVQDLHTLAPGKMDVSIRPNLLPSFDAVDQVNCTYTVRVPRTWLRHSERQAICRERYLWGSGIYTDDSDPVAAAIHSGFIKAAFNDSVDVAYLEKIMEEQNPEVDAGTSSSPVDPLPDMDCHITLLVLPLLEKYDETVRFGLRSRMWPDVSGSAVHDGASFMVLHTKWVDEGTEKGKERTAAASRKRRMALTRIEMKTGIDVKPSAKERVNRRHTAVPAT